MGQCNKFFRLLPGFMQRFEKIHVWLEAKKTSGCKHPEVLVGDGGFEPPKALPADLQSVPFGHSGNPPYMKFGAGGRIRTPDLLITNQLLYQLSYTSV